MAASSHAPAAASGLSSALRSTPRSRGARRPRRFAPQRAPFQATESGGRSGRGGWGADGAVTQCEGAWAQPCLPERRPSANKGLTVLAKEASSPPRPFTVAGGGECSRDARVGAPVVRVTSGLSMQMAANSPWAPRGWTPTAPHPAAADQRATRRQRGDAVGSRGDKGGVRSGEGAAAQHRGKGDEGAGAPRGLDDGKCTHDPAHNGMPFSFAEVGAVGGDQREIREGVHQNCFMFWPHSPDMLRMVNPGAASQQGQWQIPGAPGSAHPPEAYTAQMLMVPSPLPIPYGPWACHLWPEPYLASPPPPPQPIYPGLQCVGQDSENSRPCSRQAIRGCRAPLLPSPPPLLQTLPVPAPSPAGPSFLPPPPPPSSFPEQYSALAAAAAAPSPCARVPCGSWALDERLPPSQLPRATQDSNENRSASLAAAQRNQTTPPRQGIHYGASETSIASVLPALGDIKTASTTLGRVTSQGVLQAPRIVLAPRMPPASSETSSQPGPATARSCESHQGPRRLGARVPSSSSPPPTPRPPSPSGQMPLPSTWPPGQPSSFVGLLVPGSEARGMGWSAMPPTALDAQPPPFGSLPTVLLPPYAVFAPAMGCGQPFALSPPAGPAGPAGPTGTVASSEPCVFFALSAQGPGSGGASEGDRMDAEPCKTTPS